MMSSPWPQAVSPPRSYLNPPSRNRCEFESKFWGARNRFVSPFWVASRSTSS